ncbi:MAG: 23S rRNA (uracil-5-)-methyltransferase RumA, partial [Epulopiscium sp. Nuni2H_MBin003]
MKNDVIETKIIDMNYQGGGIARHNNLIIFIDNTTIGDLVEAVIIKEKKNYAIAKLTKIIEPSNIRENPICTSYQACGGCQIQHIKYDYQGNIKEKIVKDDLERIGKVIPKEIYPIITMESPFYYRNKAQYPIRKINGEVQIGFFATKSHRLVNIKECVIQDKKNTQIIEIVRTFLQDYNISIYDEETHRGLVRHLVIRTSHNFDETLVCLVINGDKLNYMDKLVEMLKNTV